MAPFDFDRGAYTMKLTARRNRPAWERLEQTSRHTLKHRDYSKLLVYSASGDAYDARLERQKFERRVSLQKRRMTARGRRGRPRTGSGREPTAVSTPVRHVAQASKFRRTGRRIARKGRALLMRARLLLRGEEIAGGIRAGNVIWIFGAGRTGSTWLSRVMGELKGHTVWFEPWVGSLFDPYHLRLKEREIGEHFILALEYRSTWLRSIRSFVLDGAYARFPEVMGPSNYLVVKEPGGSVGAPLLVEALPESRMILLVRDPRDVTASWMDARRKGGWRHENRNMGERKPETLADKDPDAYVRERAKTYLRNVGNAKEAYDLHEGRKALVRYEDLRDDTLGTMRRIYSELGIPMEEEKLMRAVEKHSWENIPEEEKGEGKFHRKATPGGWRGDLTPEQAKTVEKITAPLLKEFYPS